MTTQFDIEFNISNGYEELLRLQSLRENIFSINFFKFYSFVLSLFFYLFMRKNP